jgi:hypothetical protein
MEIEKYCDWAALDPLTSRNGESSPVERRAIAPVIAASNIEGFPEPSTENEPLRDPGADP